MRHSLSTLTLVLMFSMTASAQEACTSVAAATDHVTASATELFGHPPNASIHYRDERAKVLIALLLGEQPTDEQGILTATAIDIYVVKGQETAMLIFSKEDCATGAAAVQVKQLQEIINKVEQSFT